MSSLHLSIFVPLNPLALGYMLAYLELPAFAWMFSPTCTHIHVIIYRLLWSGTIFDNGMPSQGFSCARASVSFSALEQTESVACWLLGSYACVADLADRVSVMWDVNCDISFLKEPMMSWMCETCTPHRVRDEATNRSYRLREITRSCLYY